MSEPTEEELAEARAWRRANFPGIRDEPLSDSEWEPFARAIGVDPVTGEPLNDSTTITLDTDEREAMVDAVATTLAQWLVKGYGRDEQFDALVRVGRKIGMEL
jgi:hypothetical protein